MQMSHWECLARGDMKECGALREILPVMKLFESHGAL